MYEQTETWPRIALIGGGQMARALIGGWVARGAPASSIAVADPVAAQRDWLAAAYPRVRLYAENEAAAQEAEVWVLAVKPQLLQAGRRGARAARREHAAAGAVDRRRHPRRRHQPLAWRRRSASCGRCRTGRR